MFIVTTSYFIHFITSLFLAVLYKNKLKKTPNLQEQMLLSGIYIRSKHQLFKCRCLKMMPTLGFEPNLIPIIFGIFSKKFMAASKSFSIARNF